MKKFPTPLKTFTAWVMIALIRKHKQRIACLRAVRVKVLCVYRLLGGIFVWVAALLWTSYDASHARRAAIAHSAIAVGEDAIFLEPF